MVESCCWCLDLERGSKVLAWFFIVLITLHMGTEAFNFYAHVDDADLHFYIMVDLLDSVPALVANVLLLIGIHKKNAGLMLIAMVADIAMASADLVVIIIGHMFRHELDEWVWYIGPLVLGIGVYAFVVLFSYLKQLVRNQDNRGIDIPYVGVI